jgi:hypothetical protein
MKSIIAAEVNTVTIDFLQGLSEPTDSLRG